ncbi:hypothetical protein TPY_2591 [Sulfobacillus acidophilus TPY]|nr:hypothetical protein TPY_2591 [Sulfobacillus acidophilus TPY]
MEETLRIASEAPNVDLWRLVPFERHHYAEIPVLCQTGDRLMGILVC